MFGCSWFLEQLIILHIGVIFRGFLTTCVHIDCVNWIGEHAAATYRIDVITRKVFEEISAPAWLGGRVWDWQSGTPVQAHTFSPPKVGLFIARDTFKCENVAWGLGLINKWTPLMYGISFFRTRIAYWLSMETGATS